MVIHAAARFARIAGAVLFALTLAVLASGPQPGSAAEEPKAGDSRYFPGQLLVASPRIGDPRFRKSVIYMVEHSAGGALGIIVNKVYGEGELASLMKGFGMDTKGVQGQIALHFGGPVAPRGAFMLHTSDYKDSKSRAVDDTISFATDVTILKAMAEGTGPRRLLFALGYSGWSPGQLEDEIERGDWSIAKASEELVFGDGESDVWERVVEGSEVPL